MTRQEQFAQCRLINGRRSTVGFIPCRAAVVGNTMALEIDGEMQPGWRVMSAGASVAKDAMRRFERQHTRQREGSDA